MNRIVGESRVRSQGKMFFYVKKLLVVYNKLTESIKWERSKHHLKKKKEKVWIWGSDCPKLHSRRVAEPQLVAT